MSHAVRMCVPGVYMGASASAVMRCARMASRERPSGGEKTGRGRGRARGTAVLEEAEAEAEAEGETVLMTAAASAEKRGDSVEPEQEEWKESGG